MLKKWLILAVLVCVGALNYCDRAAIASVLPLIRTDLRMSDAGLAGVGSLFLWSYALASPFAGLLADRTSRSRVIVGSLITASILTALTGLVANTVQLWVVRGLLGIVEAAYLPAAMALIASYHSAESRATAIGIHTAGLAVGWIIGGTGAAYLGDHIGWHWGFVIIGLAGMVLAIPTTLIVRDKEAVEVPVPAASQTHALGSTRSTGNSMAELFRTPAFIIVLCASMAVAVGNNTFASWFPLYFSDVYHLGLSQAGLAGTAPIQSAAFMATLLGSLFSDRIARGRTRRRMLIPFIASTVAAPFLLIFLGHPGLLVLSVAVFAYTFIHVFGDCNISPIASEILPPRLWSTAFGTFNCANCLAGGLAVLFAGLLKSRFGLGGVFFGISGMTLTAGILFLVAYARWNASPPTR